MCTCNNPIEWRRIVTPEGTETNYEVSSHGDVRNAKSKEISQWIHYGRNGKQYYRANIWINGYKWGARVHRLVCTAFHDNHKRKKEVGHKDDNGLHNCAGNLEWNTRLENECNKKR